MIIIEIKYINSNGKKQWEVSYINSYCVYWHINLVVYKVLALQSGLYKKNNYMQ